MPVNPSPEPGDQDGVKVGESANPKRTITQEIQALGDKAGKTARSTAVQWVVLGSFLVSVGSFIQWTFGKVDVVNTAMAQTETKSDANAKAIVRLDATITTLDAGTRAAIERLERKIDDNNERQEKKIDRILNVVEELKKKR